MIIQGIGNCFIKQDPRTHRTHYRIYRQAIGRGVSTVALFNGWHVASVNTPEDGPVMMYIQGNNFRADSKLVGVDAYRGKKFFHTLIFGMFRKETSIKMIIL